MRAPGGDRRGDPADDPGGGVILGDGAGRVRATVAPAGASPRRRAWWSNHAAVLPYSAAVLPVTGRSARWCYEFRLLRRLNPRPIRPVTTSAIDIGSGMGVVVENVFSITEESAKLPDVRATFSRSLATERLLTPGKVTVSVALPGLDAVSVLPLESVSLRLTVPPPVPLPVSNRLASTIGTVEATV